MNFLENKTICPLPWINISSDTDGSVRLCCISDSYIHKDNGDIFNLGVDKIEDIINSAEYKKIRQSMINEEKINGCRKCYEAESNNGTSYRKQYIKLWQQDESFLKKIHQTLSEQDIEPTVEYYDLRYGNLCNLSCRSCYSGASSQFDKDIRNLQNTNIIKFHDVNNKDLNSWYETEVFYYNIVSQLPNIKEYYSTGGEPTINDKNYQILQMLIETGHSEHCAVKFNTNLTNTKKDFYSLLPKFKSSIVIASIDGYTKMQEYLRYPSDWKQISNNLCKLIDLKLSSLRLIIAPVVQKTNLGYITELFEYIEQYNRLHNETVLYLRPIILSNPPYLDFEYLPTEYKIRCWNKIEEWSRLYCNYQDEVFNQTLNQIKTKCNTKTNYEQNLQDFFEFTDIFDIYRNQNISDVNPELASLRYK